MLIRTKQYFSIAVLMAFSLLIISGCTESKKGKKKEEKQIQISKNGRYFMNADGTPFFWLGDTGWLLFSKLDRKETKKYLKDRAAKGFNVIQVMVLHGLNVTNYYGDSALVNKNVATPRVTEGNDFNKDDQYDYWDHVDFVVKEAAKLGIYVAMVPVWGSNVRSGLVNREQAEKYAKFLADRYNDKYNIIWLNGGDVKGSDSSFVWNTIGETLQKNDSNHLVTFHPFGRTSSSKWFQDAGWLDFNMFQSGHRRYEQDSTGYGEDNFKYVRDAYYKTPVKPVLDGEPSYEGIPEGLHDTTQPRWQAEDVRRYAYWSVFAGACGFTYGDNAVMQMHRPSDDESAYGAKIYWYEAINAPGAGQMKYLKKLILSRSYFDRVPDSTLIANQGKRYDHIAATRGDNYAFIYTYNGRLLKVNMGKIKGEKVKASWYNPSDGSKKNIGEFENSGVESFDPPGDKQAGNDWVLILDKV